MRHPFRLASVLATAVVLGGCGRELAPPRAPVPSVPAIPGLPEAPPSSGTGRLLLDVEGTPAMVSRTTSSSEPWIDHVRVGSRADHARAKLSADSGTPLCVTPCAVDLPVGAHPLVFTSVDDEQRTSRTIVGVHEGTSVVRHALGRDRPTKVGWVLGLMATMAGAGLTGFGALAYSAGVTRAPTPTNDDPGRGFREMGAVIGTIGIVSLTAGVVLLFTGQPVKQPGATTSFNLAR